MLYVLLEPEHLGETFWQQAMPALSAARRQKVLRFRFARDKVLSATAYLLLRLGLHEEYGMEGVPECVFGAYGKPLLRNGAVQFSLSHCAHAVACAVATEAVGADVEHWSAFAPERLDWGIQERLFSRQELEIIRAASDGQREACVLWTAKESVGKFTGEGLGDDLPSALRRTDVQVDHYAFDAHRVSGAVCRWAHGEQRPLRCREVSHRDLLAFLQHCLTVDETS